MTRNLDHANHAQNRFVPRPAMTGPAPQSHYAHMPGSGIHGRYTRRRPRRWLAFTSATARRTVRSEPVQPKAVSLSKARSARILACDRSTHSSIFAKERIDDPPPAPRPVAGQLAGVALSDITGHSVMRHAGHLTGATQRPSHVERFQHGHGFLARLHWLLRLDGHGCRDRPFE